MITPPIRPPKPRLYHFTSREHFQEIDKLGIILRAESNVGSPITGWEPSGAHYATDVVWLLDTPHLDYPHGLAGSIQDKTAVSIEVTIPGIPWNEWVPAQAMHPLWRRHFLEFAGGEEAAKHWYVWPAPIKRRFWGEITIRPEEAQA